MLENAQKILKHYWGYSSFRKGQPEVISQILEGKDTLALMPTGGGKSLCFQVPAMVMPGICLVISPLVALMQEQVESLRALGIRATSIVGGLSRKELDRRFDNCFNGDFKFLYLSPERMLQEETRQRISHLPVNLIAVDEAHCISEWGHDFRPAYRQIHHLRDLHPEVPLIALTATATEKTAQDICENLHIATENRIKHSYERPNLGIYLNKSEYKPKYLIEFLNQVNAPAIIYVRNRKSTIELSEYLNDQGISAGAFNGGLPQKDRQLLLKNWQAEQFLVMVATTAFGMGIDKQNVRAIVHYQIPESLESYYQEVGRAGRDNKPAKAVLLYNDNDIKVVQHQFLGNFPTPKNVKKIYRRLNNYLQIPYGEGFETTHNFSFSKFCKVNQLNFQLTYEVFTLLDRAGVIGLSKEFRKKTSLSFRMNNRALYTFLERDRRFALLIKTILRQNGGFFSSKIPLQLNVISKKTKLPTPQIRKLLIELEKREIIDLTIARQDTSITFLKAREDDYTINPLIPYIRQQYQNKKEKLSAMLNFVQIQERCKTIEVLDYFGEKKTKNCGRCSYCLSHQHDQNAKDNRELIEIILNELDEEAASSRDLAAALSIGSSTLLPVLSFMLDKKLIKLTQNNKYQRLS